MIEYAEILTKAELAGFYSSIIKRTETNKTHATELLHSIQQEFTKAYDDFEAKGVEEYYKQLKDLSFIEQAWQQKKCLTCQAKLRLVSGDFGSFWGCPNYRDGKEHRSFSEEFEEQFAVRKSLCRVRIDSNWATQLIKNLKLPAFIKATDVLNFVDEIGLLDLREKYGYSGSKDRISGYVKAKKASLAEEKEIGSFLFPFFPKAISQLGIKYKRTNEKESVAILDLMLSDDTTVNLLEIKRSAYDLDEEQLRLYKSLVEFVLNKSNDSRKLTALFIVYNTTQLYFPIKTPYLLFDEIRKFKHKEIFVFVFEQKAII